MRPRSLARLVAGARRSSVLDSMQIAALVLVLACIALLALWSNVAAAMQGERVAAYPVGSIAAGFVPRGGGLDPVRVQGPVQACNGATQQLQIKGNWIPIERVWRPIDAGAITSGPTSTEHPMPYGTPLWGVLLQDPHNGGGYAGEITLGSYGGHRWTDTGRLVICLWVDPAMAEPVPDCGTSSPRHRRIHVENVSGR